MLHRRFPLLALTLVLTLSPAVLGASAPEPGTLFLYPERIDLGDDGFAEAERGVLFVPVRRSHPESGVLGLEVYRFRATAKTDNLPIFLLHGGPGWPGFGDSLEEPGYYERRIRPFIEVADLIVVGQRGIGSSKPDTACEPPAEVAPDVVLADDEAAAQLRETAARCKSFWDGQGLDLKGFTVVEAAADVDDVREALGYERIVLWGGSFGSHWSLAVMRFHPEIVARAVLRGLEGPDHTYDMPSEVLEDLERIAAAAEASPDLRPLIPEEGLLDAFRKVVARAEDEPIEVEVRGEDGELQTVRFDAEDVRGMAMGTTRSARSRDSLPRWPGEILELVAGDFRNAAKAKLRRGSGFPTASFFMLDCGSGISKVRAAELAADETVATVGRIGSFYQATCPVWESDLGEEFRRNFPTEIPTVLVHGNWDLSTPLGNVLDLVPYFENGKLVVVDGGTHSALTQALEASESFREALMGFVWTGDYEAVPTEVKMPPIAWEVPEDEGSPPKELDKYWMVFLERGDDPPQLDEEASAELQRRHLAHLSKMHREGYSLVAGPFEVGEEEPLRGIVLYRGDLEGDRVRELASADPAVEAGRLKVRVMKWWTPGGAMTFPDD